MIRTALISIAIGLLGSASLQAGVNETAASPSIAEQHEPVLLAQSNSKKRRDERQDDRGRSDDREDRKDCRDEEGVAGKDKRDCKQDARKGENDKED
jgi:hypothetical protein